MTFAAQETSVEGGEPVELYQFDMGTNTWWFTSSQEDQTIAGDTYTAIPIKRGNLIQAVDERSGDKLLVEIPKSESFVSNFIVNVPGKSATLILKRFHETDATKELITLFEGTVQTVKFSKSGKLAVFSIMPSTAGKTRHMPVFTYQGICNHQLYDDRCKVAESASFKKVLTCSAVSTNGLTLTISGASGFGSDFFVGGSMEFDGEWRVVLAQSGNDLTTNVRFVSSPLSQSITCLAGCDHSTDVCNTKFSNLPNYGGWPAVPKKNIFATGLD